MSENTEGCRSSGVRHRVMAVPDGVLSTCQDLYPNNLGGNVLCGIRTRLQNCTVQVISNSTPC